MTVDSVDTTHECPKPGCELRVPFDRLACAPHWREISTDIQQRILRLWRHRPGSNIYFKARAQALRELGVPDDQVAELNGGVS